MVEYWAYADYRDLLDMTEVLRTAAQEVLGTTTITTVVSYDFGQPFKRHPAPRFWITAASPMPT